MKSFDDFTKMTLKDSDLLFLIDDYIGSGKTVTKCLEEISLKNNKLKERIHILSLAVQKQTIDLINSMGIPFHYHHVEQKGITDFYEKASAENKIATMRTIEKKLKLNPKYSLGFEESESLITLIRTPNNTFPIFWDDYEIKGEKKKAPFPRY